MKVDEELAVETSLPAAVEEDCSVDRDDGGGGGGNPVPPLVGGG